MEEDEVLEEEIFDRREQTENASLKHSEEEDEVLDECVFDKQKSEEDEELTPRKVAHTVKEIYGDYKKAYSSTSKRDKVKILLIIVPLVITFILGAVGIVIANIGQSLGLENVELAGVIIIAIGFGGFFMTIVLLGIISKLKGGK